MEYMSGDVDAWEKALSDARDLEHQACGVETNADDDAAFAFLVNDFVNVTIDRRYAVRNVCLWASAHRT